MTRFKKTHIMPLILQVEPHTLALPNTVPLAQRQPQIITGLVRWASPDWNEAEYEKVQRTVDNIKATGTGVEIENFVTKVAEAIKQVIPGRNFSVTLGSFGIEYKTEKGPLRV